MVCLLINHSPNYQNEYKKINLVKLDWMDFDVQCLLFDPCYLISQHLIIAGFTPRSNMFDRKYLDQKINCFNRFVS